MTFENDFHIARMKTPMGGLFLMASDEALVRILFDQDESPPFKQTSIPATTPLLRHAIQELDAYFQSKLQTFSIPCQPQGTPFQQQAWNLLLQVSMGQVRTYQELAIELGRPKAARAIGGAMNKNPIPIVYPCHRVIGTNRTLVGYAGGLSKKTWLLAHEGYLRAIPSPTMVSPISALTPP